MCDVNLNSDGEVWVAICRDTNGLPWNICHMEVLEGEPKWGDQDVPIGHQHWIYVANVNGGDSELRRIIVGGMKE